MSDKSAIEWTDATWNPTVGCSLVSPGCTNCYAMQMAARIERMFDGKTHYAGTTMPSKAGPVWTGKVFLAPDEILTKPLRWKRPRRIFVNSMSDLFHENLTDEAIDRIFAVMALCPQHTFQVLTKRPARMREYLTAPGVVRRIYGTACDLVIELEPGVVLIGPGVDETQAPRGPRVYLDEWPLSQIWLGVSVEDQKRAEERVDLLLDTPAAKRFLSIEPLLGPVDLNWIVLHRDANGEETDALTSLPTPGDPHCVGRRFIDWVIVGGESGPGARPMHPDWVIGLRDQCTAAGVPFFFKQWGNWGCMGMSRPGDSGMIVGYGDNDSHNMPMVNIGKKRTGRMLDGRTWDEVPA